MECILLLNTDVVVLRQLLVMRREYNHVVNDLNYGQHIWWNW